ncbi:ribokinase [Loigolactobacillus backii]|uniref:Ribokinase n=1 Tax=Loigolactobacillus backii TaxID=375175 RepID=A0A192H0J5_9LACO|nr:ribokinase [Loigolactobacillus backii]ANK60560.1 hypothetical protein AYR52_10040 [Loigolactobacillus backii]ANK61875.1 hypothetical protein AYR53_03285 [Loigolactobacillus backii]ANK65512.1 hypothetical protein AYR54_09840 [Loigolactobacillus backii]ANK67984.1 hypothetical protein AYR55_09965 [Loigolactobacillus backii]ANK68931.1 hypothetical protein AYR56_01440 [Loigolactobacillus backii]
MAKNITVIGSLNLDIHIPVEHIPTQGETLGLLRASTQAAGGKGANQAVAAARLGAQVHFIGATGNDAAGRMLISKCKAEGIDVSAISALDGKNTGQAFIILEPDGHNTIMVEGGANKLVSNAAIETAADKIRQSDIVIAQLETNFEPIIATFKIAKEAGVPTILNPAPANKPVPDELLQLTDIVTPNETEAATLTGHKAVTGADFAAITTAFQTKSIPNTLITLGSKGVYYNVAAQTGVVAAHKVARPVDTTAAGDTFIGAMAAVLNKDLSNVKAAIDFANAASSLTIQRAGAMDSIPTKAEVDALLF